MEIHKEQLSKLFESLESTKRGLYSINAEKKLKEFGKNILTTKKKESLVLKFLKQFKNFFAILLIVGSILSFIAEYISPAEGNIYIGIALIGVVLLNAIFTFIQQYQSDKIMETFKKMLPEKTRVLRDNKFIEIDSENLVPGDIIEVSEGDKVPADARIIESNTLKVDNSSITGESEPQLRSTEYSSDNILESRNMIFSGTLVLSGSGKALVCNTGMNTQIGKIVKLTKETKSIKTPLQKELERFIKIISIIAVALGLVFFIASFFIGHRFIASLIFAIGIIVANVPEGLLPTVTLCLSIASKRMAKKNALIKNLESVETLGSTTVICTDKTGTITQNKMDVTTIYNGFVEKNRYEKNISSIENFDKLIRASALCNNSRFDQTKKIYLGDPTEIALMKFADSFEKSKNIIQSYKRLSEDPFDSKTKRMITTNLVGNKKISYMKGAPEIVLSQCTKIFKDGKEIKLTDKKKSEIIEMYKKMAQRAERILAFAYKVSDDTSFIFTGLIGMMDPPREEVADAISRCKTAGIRVIMITGDYSLTAESIARKVGMIDNRPANIITGDKLEKMSDAELRKVFDKENLIFARTSPSQKLQIVKGLQSLGEIVTVTGDGVNDAPALKNADMGVSMGVCGTEVAREASNMVLMDDNFATIVNAVEEGRTIFENIKKFIAYILTSNIPEILPFIAFVLLKIPLPMTVILILSIDLGSDLLPAIGLGTEPPESNIMNKKPRSKSERLFTSKLLFMSYGVYGMIQAAAGFTSYFYVLFKGGWAWGQELLYTNPLYQKAVTAFFASIIICQIANLIAIKSRKETSFNKNIFKNKIMLAGILVEIIILLVIVYLPYTHAFFDTYPLSAFELLLSLPFAGLILFGDEFRKFLLRRGNKFVKNYLTW